ncbi:MAG: lipid-A-disaccharide synthase [Motiliproteus sp.]|nr:lipid-A-disaccharide synthase [Motiliproteus sp.]MCW9054071.1 lipid-A-disaccharide synthase [Motiliproteus sp.]
MRIALVAGEASGDILGAGLIKALKQRCPDLQFEGIGGPLMLEQGMTSFFPMERLSVMGLVEVLGRFRELLGIRNQLRDRWLDNPPDILIGIDAPDFNLPLERRLRESGVTTCHYVSPSVWAWREGRVKKIARSVDLMLCLLPFEKAFYDRHDVDARFIGHTLADDIAMQPDTNAARVELELDAEARWVAMLPGSRGGEVERLAPVFLDTARWLLEREPDLRFVVPAANQERYQQLEAMVADSGLSIRLIHGKSRQVMQAADAVLMASGTASLEGMLLKKPMVVAYKLAPLTHAIASRMLKIRYMSLPNLLADAPLVPEFLQDQVTPEAVGQALLNQLTDQQHHDQTVQRFTELHQQLRLNASEKAASAILELIDSAKSAC